MYTSMLRPMKYPDSPPHEAADEVALRRPAFRCISSLSTSPSLRVSRCSPPGQYFQHVRLPVEGERSDAQRVALPLVPGLCSFQQTADAEKEFLVVERLDYIVVRSRLEALGPILDPVAGGQDEDGQRGRDLSRSSVRAKPSRPGSMTSSTARSTSAAW